MIVGLFYEYTTTYVMFGEQNLDILKVSAMMLRGISTFALRNLCLIKRFIEWVKGPLKIAIGF